ncbi:MAG: hypothetical protein Q8N90_00925 [bacterium]|nr:hypothetical protein [bacterium]
MQKREVISKIKSLKSIKPDSNWAISARHSLLAYVANFQPAALIRRAFYFPAFSKLAVGFASFSLIFSGLLVSAQSAGINSPLYAIKTASQKALIALTPKEHKLDLKIAFAHNMINDLQKATGDGRVIAVANDISRDLNDITADLKQVAHPQRVVALSKQIQEETSQVKNFAKDNEELGNSLDKINSQVFALAKDAEDKINNCPAYISKQITDLTNYVDATSIADEGQKSIAKQLEEANGYLKSGQCVDALVIIDAINKDLAAPIAE